MKVTVKTPLWGQWSDLIAINPVRSPNISALLHYTKINFFIQGFDQ